ncbi:MAG: phospholipase [Rickettsiaceae bacterium]|jgi:poly(3-hydroxybutyrate) depolymerase|nr:phospholipase [Rickettsiaceae bacterium]
MKNHQTRSVLDTAQSTTTVTIPNTAGRSVVECLPPNPTAAGSSLLVLLCGGTSDGSSFIPLCPAFANGGIISVFPNPHTNSSKTWNAGDCCEPASAQNIDDVGFVSKIIDYYLATYPNINPNKIFVSGLSNGGMLAFRVARNDSRIAGVLTSSTTDSSMSETNPGRKIHFLMYHGVNDTNIPTNGGTGGLLTYVKPSQQAVLTKWSASNECTSNTTTSFPRYSETLFNCPNSTDMKYELVNGVGHQWQMMPAFNTTSELVNFVQNHQRVGTLATPGVAPSPVPAPVKVTPSPSKKTPPIPAISSEGAVISSNPITDLAVAAKIGISALPGVYESVKTTLQDPAVVSAATQSFVGGTASGVVLELTNNVTAAQFAGAVPMAISTGSFWPFLVPAATKIMDYAGCSRETKELVADTMQYASNAMLTAFEHKAPEIMLASLAATYVGKQVGSGVLKSGKWAAQEIEKRVVGVASVDVDLSKGFSM